jgi:transposase
VANKGQRSSARSKSASGVRAKRGRRAENDVGIDPHKRMLTVSVVEPTGAVLATASFRISGVGHRAMEAFVLGFGPTRTWAIEGAAWLGRHTAMFLVRAGYDVRDVCPNRTAEEAKKRRQGKSDVLDSVRIAREAKRDRDLPVAFKRAGGETGPDRQREQIALWHNARTSVVKTRQHVTNEAEALLCALPEELREQLPDTSRIRPRLRALSKIDRQVVSDEVTQLRLRLLDDYCVQLVDLDAREKLAAKELTRLIAATGSTLHTLVGIADRSEAELLIEVGDPRRFNGEGGLARFNGSAPLPATSGEGGGPPKRHRLSRGGNRRVNAVLHRMAMTQLRCEPKAREIYDRARQRGHTKREAMRILKRQLSNVIYRRMMADLNRQQAPTTQTTSAAA